MQPQRLAHPLQADATGQLLIQRHVGHLHGTAEPHRLQPLAHEWVGIPDVGDHLVNAAHGAQRQADQGVGDLEGGSGREALLGAAGRATDTGSY